MHVATDFNLLPQQFQPINLETLLHRGTHFVYGTIQGKTLFVVISVASARLYIYTRASASHAPSELFTGKNHVLEATQKRFKIIYWEVSTAGMPRG